RSPTRRHEGRAVFYGRCRTLLGRALECRTLSRDPQPLTGFVVQRTAIPYRRLGFELEGYRLHRSQRQGAVPAPCRRIVRRSSQVYTGATRRLAIYAVARIGIRENAAGSVGTGAAGDAVLEGVRRQTGRQGAERSIKCLDRSIRPVGDEIGGILPVTHRQRED